MADRIYKGKLRPEQNPAFPEAACDFHLPHAGGLVPFEMLKKILSTALYAEGSDIPLYEEINGSIWLHGLNGLWVKIDPDGSLEVGASG